uniref:5-formyltetrahydrofolate cyclo-ligase n=1 Tax=Globisporangium ultimum (strain ATCC 200006 / CBS 805.95 / DAOM BR144) TaxID=431595 RepID=K3W867_GLOUD
MAGVKKELRKQIAAVLKATEAAEVALQSQQLTERIYALPEFRNAKVLSVYLEMPKEAATRGLLTAAFEAGKKVYVPKITGRGAEDLKMVQALSMNDINTFPKDKWQIPDPPLTSASGDAREDPIAALDLELVLMPGVAFDRSGGRLGHGKGYYDSFLRRLGEAYAKSGKPLPTTIGLCLSCQLVDQVPLSPHDKMLDIIVTPEEVVTQRWPRIVLIWQFDPMGKHGVLYLLCVVLLVAVAAAQDLYEVLGVSASATPAQMKKAYRKLSLKYHPDKQTGETREAVKEQFVKVTNAYRVLSDPARREKYDLYGIADEQEFKNFDEALRFSHEGVEDSLLNWLGLVAILAIGIVPIVIMQRNRTKPLKKRRPAKPVKK